jgi:hypothetical protein
MGSALIGAGELGANAGARRRAFSLLACVGDPVVAGVSAVYLISQA